MAIWTTSAVVKTGLERMLRDESSDATLPPSWDAEIDQALDKAERQMIAVLTGNRGYALADITLAKWPTGTGYQIDLAAHHFLIRYYGGHQQENVPQELIDRLNRLSELEEDILVDAAGAIIEPTLAGGTPIGGDIRDDGEFITAALDDPRLYIEGPFPQEDGSISTAGL